MKKKVSITVKDKVFRKEDINRILALFYELYQSFETTRYKRLSVVADCQNDEEYTLSDQDPSGFEQILETKKIKKINVLFTSTEDDQRIYLNIEHGDSSFASNYINIEGENETWVDSNYKKFSDLIDSVKPQWCFIKKYSFPLFLAISMFNGILLSRTLANILQRMDYQAPSVNDQKIVGFLITKMTEIIPISTWAVYILVAIWIGGIATFPFWIQISSLASSTWPSIEFDFGPEHMRKPTRYRSIWAYLGTAVFIPILLQFLV